MTRDRLKEPHLRSETMRMRLAHYCARSSFAGVGLVGGASATAGGGFGAWEAWWPLQYADQNKCAIEGFQEGTRLSPNVSERRSSGNAVRTAGHIVAALIRFDAHRSPVAEVDLMLCLSR